MGYWTKYEYWLPHAPCSGWNRLLCNSANRPRGKGQSCRLGNSSGLRELGSGQRTREIGTAASSDPPPCYHGGELLGMENESSAEFFTTSVPYIPHHHQGLQVTGSGNVVCNVTPVSLRDKNLLPGKVASSQLPP